MAVEKVYGRTSENGGISAAAVFSAMGGSKLLFDYAMDQADKAELVHRAHTGAHLWILPKGRQFLVDLLNVK